jgi:hypothetical protein
MAEACYTARATTKQQVLDGIRKLTLQTNKNGQYTRDAILLLEKGIQHVLQSQFNPSNPGKVMEKLLDTGDNQLTPRTTGYLLNLPATSVPSTFLRALRNLMYGVEFWSVLGLRATSHSSINSTATWMRHVLGPHVSCDKC